MVEITKYTFIDEVTFFIMSRGNKVTFQDIEEHLKTLDRKLVGQARIKDKFHDNITYWKGLSMSASQWIMYMIEENMIKLTPAHYSVYKPCIMHEFTIAKTLKNRAVESWFPVTVSVNENFNMKKQFDILYQ